MWNKSSQKSITVIYTTKNDRSKYSHFDRHRARAHAVMKIIQRALATPLTILAHSPKVRQTTEGTRAEAICASEEPLSRAGALISARGAREFIMQWIIVGVSIKVDWAMFYARRPSPFSRARSLALLLLLLLLAVVASARHVINGALYIPAWEREGERERERERAHDRGIITIMCCSGAGQGRPRGYDRYGKLEAVAHWAGSQRYQWVHTRIPCIFRPLWLCMCVCLHVCVSERGESICVPRISHVGNGTARRDARDD